MTSFVKSKAFFVKFCSASLLCLVRSLLPFLFGAVFSTSLELCHGRFADEEESSDNALTCPAQSPHGVQAQISSLLFVNRKATSSRLLPES